jgi:hypothetical protein
VDTSQGPSHETPLVRSWRGRRCARNSHYRKRNYTGERLLVWEPIRLYRIEVGRDGTVSRIALKSPAGKSYLLYIEPVVKFRDDLYLLEPPHLGHLLPQLHRIRGDRLEPISAEEIGMRERYGPWGGLRSATAAVVRDLGNCKPTSEVRRLAR